MCFNLSACEFETKQMNGYFICNLIFSAWNPIEKSELKRLQCHVEISIKINHRYQKPNSFGMVVWWHHGSFTVCNPCDTFINASHPIFTCIEITLGSNHTRHPTYLYDVHGVYGIFLYSKLCFHSFSIHSQPHLCLFRSRWYFHPILIVHRTIIVQNEILIPNNFHYWLPAPGLPMPRCASARIIRGIQLNSTEWNRSSEKWIQFAYR